MRPSSNTVREPQRFSGAALTAAREDAGLTRTQLAALVGRSADAVRFYETGTVTPPGDIVGALVHHLGCTFDQLYIGPAPADSSS